MAMEYFDGISPDANIPESGVLSREQIESLWGHVGGDKSKAKLMSDVALAESGGDIRAISSSHDYGLWQVNSIHFGLAGLNSVNVFWPHANAVIARILSSNGTNIAPWCTAWANPGRDCGHGQLSSPQPGSRIWITQGYSETPPTSSDGSGSAPVPTGSGSWAELDAAWQGLMDIPAQFQPQILDSLQAVIERAARIRNNA